MTLTKKLAWVLSWALLSLSYSVSNAQSPTGQLDPSQVYTTGNIVQPTNPGANSTPWVNGVYQDSLTCWGWGNPGYCGPNAIVRPGGSINFSFGLTNLYQMQSIANVLPNSGSGLKVNGYNFGFTAKNGNGWDDGRVDYLNAYVNFYDGKGSTVYNKNYNLNYKFGWTTFNFTENFNTPFASKDLGSVQYGFVGRDNNYWAGPYGPEVYNVNFSLKYSVDPCSVNILSSPSCPGYMDQITKFNTPTNTVESALLPPSSPPVVNDTLAISLQPSSPNLGTVQGSGPVQAPSALFTPSPSIATNTSQSEKTVAGPSISSILGIVRNEQSRIAGIETAAVVQANEVASSLSTQAQQQAEQTAAIAVSASQTTQQYERTTSISSSNSQSNSFTHSISGRVSYGIVQVPSLQAPQSTIEASPSRATSSPSFQSLQNSIIAPSSRITSGPSSQALQNSIEVPSSGVIAGTVRVQPEIVTNQPPPMSFSSAAPQGLIKKVEETNTSSSYNSSQSLGVSLIPEVKKIETVKVQEQETPKQTSIDFTGRSPIKDYLDSRTLMTQDIGRAEQKTTEAKKNVQDNEAAGGVALTTMAKQPLGFELYMQNMRDVAFYPPKEIYKTQRIIDNQRVLRQLNSRSDRLHEEMVNEQYKN